MKRHAARFYTQIVNDHIHTADLSARPSSCAATRALHL
jgi:hypothetical protein